MSHPSVSPAEDMYCVQAGHATLPHCWYMQEPAACRGEVNKNTYSYVRDCHLEFVKLSESLTMAIAPLLTVLGAINIASLEVESLHAENGHVRHNSMLR